jgi:hypothetical protein
MSSAYRTLDFENAKVIHNGARKTTVMTDGLLATGEIKGLHLHEAFGTDNLANLNMG